MRYPDDPGWVRGNQSSFDGAVAAAKTKVAKQSVIENLVNNSGPRGLTCEEIEDKTGWLHQTVSARIRELIIEGRIAKAPFKRPSRAGVNVTVYIRKPRRRRLIGRVNVNDPQPTSEQR
jgi:hypothetical protein